MRATLTKKTLFRKLDALDIDIQRLSVRTEPPNKLWVDVYGPGMRRPVLATSVLAGSINLKSLAGDQLIIDDRTLWQALDAGAETCRALCHEWATHRAALES